MKNFTIKTNVTTIAMYMQFTDYETGKKRYEWVVDTYCRMNPKKDFINNFMSEYAGNGIEKIKIIEEFENEYEIENITDLDVVMNHILDDFPNINHTVLGY